MTNKMLASVFEKAKQDGRICSHCGWIITKKNWNLGYKLCAGCYSAMKGVKITWGWYPPSDDVQDKTGEML